MHVESWFWVVAEGGRRSGGACCGFLLEHGFSRSAFEVYQVELPPGAETVRHDHLDDRVEDVYAILLGEGFVIVDDVPVPVEPGEFNVVTVESAGQVRAGEAGLEFIALCAAPRSPRPSTSAPP